MVRSRVLQNPLSARRSHSLAHRVPWSVDRSAPPVYRLVNTSDEMLRGVTVSLAGGSHLRVTAPSSIAPGAAVMATVTGTELERATILVVRWFLSDGSEYLWQVSF